jgi:hypothetical protein
MPQIWPNDDEVASRRAKYARHLPTQPLRSSPVPPALADQPEFRSLADEREQLIRAEARYRAEAIDHTRRVEEARAKHADQVRAAMLDPDSKHPGAFVEPPNPYAVVAPASVYDERHRVLEAFEVGVLEEHADRWRELLEADAAPIRSGIERARRELADLEARLRPLDQALGELDRLGRWPSGGEQRPQIPRAARLDNTPEARAAIAEVDAMLMESRRRPVRRRGLR